jgi:hypothetical protein
MSQGRETKVHRFILPRQVFDDSSKTAERQRQARLEDEERQRQAMCLELSEIRWVPVLRHRPVPYMPWRTPDGADGSGCDTDVASPAQSRLHEDVWHCSAKYAIVAADFVAERVKATFGWTR